VKKSRSTRTSNKLTPTSIDPTAIPKNLRAFNLSPKIADQNNANVKDVKKPTLTSKSSSNRSTKSTRSNKVHPTTPISEKSLPKNLRPFNSSPVLNQKNDADNNESGINESGSNDDFNLSSLSLVDDVFCSTRTDQYLSPLPVGDWETLSATSTSSTSELLKTPVLRTPPSCFASPIASPIHSLRIAESEEEVSDSEFSQINEPIRPITAENIEFENNEPKSADLKYIELKNTDLDTTDLKTTEFICELTPVAKPVSANKSVSKPINHKISIETHKTSSQKQNSSDDIKTEPVTNPSICKKIEPDFKLKSDYTPERYVLRNERANKRNKLDNTSIENDLVNPEEKNEQDNYRRYLYKSMKSKLELSRGEAILEGNCAKCEVELFYLPTVRVNCGHHICFGCSNKFSVNEHGNCQLCSGSAQEVIDALKLKKIDVPSDQLD